MLLVPVVWHKCFSKEQILHVIWPIECGPRNNCDNGELYCSLINVNRAEMTHKNSNQSSVFVSWLWVDVNYSALTSRGQYDTQTNFSIVSVFIIMVYISMYSWLLAKTLNRLGPHFFFFHALVNFGLFCILTKTYSYLYSVGFYCGVCSYMM